MALKMAAATIDEQDSWPLGVGCSPLAADLEDSASTIDMRCAPLPMSNNSAADHYQVALIPLPSMVQRMEKGPQGFTDLSSVVVLPLTWKDVVSRLQSPSAPSKTRQNSEVIIF